MSASVLAACALVAISESLQHAQARRTVNQEVAEKLKTCRPQFPEEGDRFPANRNSAAGYSLLDWWEGMSARLSEKLSDHLLRNGVETCRVLTVKKDWKSTHTFTTFKP